MKCYQKTLHICHFLTKLVHNMVNSFTSIMGLKGMALLVFLYCVSITSADQGKRFAMYEGKGPGSLSAAATITSSDPITCARTCVRRINCLSFSIHDSTCSLYDTYVEDPSQLTTQTGQALESLSSLCGEL